MEIRMSMINLWYKFFKNLYKHSAQLPAIERVNGDKEWYINGKRHRDGGFPAVELASGTKCWYVNGERHRETPWGAPSENFRL
jgi:hypothetical protein